MNKMKKFLYQFLAFIKETASYFHITTDCNAKGNGLRSQLKKKCSKMTDRFSLNEYTSSLQKCNPIKNSAKHRKNDILKQNIL